jgi:hypothetical protein
MDTAGVDVNRIKQNVSEYWHAESWNWPVKVMSVQRALALGASVGQVVPVKGFVTSEKFVRGRSLEEVERILGAATGRVEGWRSSLAAELSSAPTPVRA